MNTHETVRRLAMEMPKVEERTCYGTPGFYAKRKLFARLLEDDDLVVVKTDPKKREILMQADPRAFFVTDHYLNYPMMIIRLSAVNEEDLQELLRDAWEHATS